MTLALNCLARLIFASMLLLILLCSRFKCSVSTSTAVKSAWNAPAILAAVRMTLALVGEGDRQTSTCSFVKYSFPAASRSRITSRFTRSAVRLNAISRRAERFSNVKKLIFALSAWFLWYILPSSRRWRSSSGEISTSSTWLALSNTESGMRSLTRTWVMDATIS